MIRVVMFDFGDTLVCDGAVLPYVPEALDAIAGFVNAQAAPLLTCLVSDFPLPPPPSTEEKVETIFKDYITLLDGLGLTQFFEPVTERVTLSTHAGISKPDRKVFEKAVERLRMSASLKECLFITEKTEHVVACRELLGMATLQFGSTQGPGVDFTDWSEAALLIARVVAPENIGNLQSAVRLRLGVTEDLEVASMTPASGRGMFHGAGRKWCAVPDVGAGMEGLCVPLPVEFEITLDDRGHVCSVETGEPEPEALAEAAQFVKTLQANAQLSSKPGQLRPGATHQIEMDHRGRKKLVRKRFSAV